MVRGGEKQGSADLDKREGKVYIGIPIKGRGKEVMERKKTIDPYWRCIV